MVPDGGLELSEEREFEGATEAEALQSAADALDTTPEKLDVTVLDEGAEGAFGLGARPVKIRVELKSGDDAPEADDTDDVGEAPPTVSIEEKVSQAQAVTHDLMERMGLDARVEARDADDHILVEIKEMFYALAILYYTLQLWLISERDLRPSEPSSP